MENHKLIPLSQSELTSNSGGYAWWQLLITVCMLYDAVNAASEGAEEEVNNVLESKGWL